MKKILSLILLSIIAITSFAQNLSTTEKAQKVLGYLMNYKGDSVYVDLSQTIKSMITPLQLSTMWYTFTLQYGNFKEVTDWQEQQSMGYDIATSKLVFEKGKLNYIITFKGNAIEGLLFQPIKEVRAAEAKETDKFKEEKMELCCDGYKMPAILTLPAKVENPPCVIIVHGSGPADMNGSFGKTTIYKDIAHKLAENGIATFRYDKRTYIYKNIPDSLTDKLTVDYETTDDAIAAVNMLKNNPKIDKDNIFIIGHSQGGMMIPRIAQRTSDVRGYIMLSAPARKLLDMIMDQMEYLYTISMNPSWPQIKPEMERQIANFNKYGTNEFCDSISLPMGLPATYLLDLKEYDQTEEAKKICSPLLIINGEGDYQVTMKDFEKWKDVLGKKDNVQFKSYPGLNHIYTKSSNPPSPMDYEKEAEFSDTVIKDISEWIKSNLKR